VVVDGDRRDLIIYDQGLAVLTGSRRSKLPAWESRLWAVAGQGLEAIMADPGNRYLPFDEVTRCVRTNPSVPGRLLTLVGGLRFFTGGTAFAFEVTTRAGVTTRVRWGMETAFAEGSGVVLQRCVEMLADLRDPAVSPSEPPPPQ
jgi:hypothetical protein